MMGPLDVMAGYQWVAFLDVVRVEAAADHTLIDISSNHYRRALGCSFPKAA